MESVISKSKDRSDDLIDYRSLLDNLDSGIVIHDQNGFIIAINQAACNMLSAKAEDIIGVNALEHAGTTYRLDGSKWAAEDNPIAAALKDGEESRGVTMGIDVPTEDGALTRLWTITNTKLIKLHSGETGVAATFTDVTSMQNQSHQLQTAYEKFSALLARSDSVVTVSDAEGKITYASPSFLHLTGIDEREVLNTYIRDYIHPEDLEAEAEKIEYLRENFNSTVELNLRVRAANKSWRHLEIMSTNHLNDPAIGGVVGSGRDVTNKVKETAGLAYQATHDALTGLANRALLLDHLDIAIARAKRSGIPIALYYMDIDGFKKVNDTYGHGTGDKLIVTVAERLKEATRPGDTIARIGGDEFVMLAEGILDVTTALSIAERVRKAIHKPMLLANETINISTSIGISLSRNSSSQAMLDEADSALYKAKHHGGNRFEIYDEVMKQDVFGKSIKIALLENIIQNQDLRLTFLPVIALETHKVMAASASFVTHLPDSTTMAMSDILPFACENNLGYELYETILNNICLSLTKRGADPGGEEILKSKCVIRLPLADKLLLDNTTPMRISSLVHKHGLQKELFCFEIDEQALLDTGHNAFSTISEFSKIGFNVLLGNVGMGWSNFGLLADLPISRIKTDPILAEQVAGEEDSGSIVKVIAAIGKALNLMTVSCGVRLRSQTKTLFELGYTEAEGPLFGHAITIDELHIAQ
jgi:diguanylate cyclase (GGDEF)-like protein/PAS domain S-box-containing protein